MANKTPCKRKKGRPTLRDSLRLNEMADLCAKTIIDGLRSKNVPFDLKLKVASQVYGKMTPKDISITQERLKATVIQITHEPKHVIDISPSTLESKAG